MKGYQALAELVRRNDFGVAFAMLGGSNVPWIAQGVDGGTLHLVKTRHEDAAVGGAVGYARSTARPALCSVTRGPGFTNAVSALVAAVKSHLPILMITGESPTTALPSQSVNQAGLARTIGVGFHHVSAVDHLAGTFQNAMRHLLSTARPQVLSVDGAIFGHDVELGEHVATEPAPPGAVPDPAAVAGVVRMLRAARHPVLLAGSGAVFARCRDELIELAELSGAQLATTLRALNLFRDHPAELGLCGGWSPPAVRRELAEADLVVAFGASLNDFTTDQGTTFPRAQVVHCELVPDREHGLVRPTVVLRGDARQCAVALLRQWGSGPGSAVRPAQAAVCREEVRRSALTFPLRHDPSRGLDPREVYARLDDLLPDDRVVVTDSGRFLGTLPSLVGSKDATSWLVGNSYSCVGLGLGSAIGACVAHPGRPVVLFVGDGGFMMSSHDLDAVRLNGLDLTVVVINDQQYGSDVKYLARYGHRAAVITQPLPDVTQLAAAFGGRGVVIRRLDELEDIDFRRRGLQILDIRVDPEVNVREVLAGWSAQARRPAEAGVAMS